MFGPFSSELPGVKNRSQHRDSVHFIYLFIYFDKVENANQAVEIVNVVYDPDTVTADYAQFWFCSFCSGIFMLKMYLFRH